MNPHRKSLVPLIVMAVLAVILAACAAPAPAAAPAAPAASASKATEAPAAPAATEAAKVTESPAAAAAGEAQPSATEAPKATESPKAAEPAQAATASTADSQNQALTQALTATAQPARATAAEPTSVVAVPVAAPSATAEPIVVPTAMSLPDTATPLPVPTLKPFATDTRVPTAILPTETAAPEKPKEEPTTTQPKAAAPEATTPTETLAPPTSTPLPPTPTVEVATATSDAAASNKLAATIAPTEAAKLPPLTITPTAVIAAPPAESAQRPITVETRIVELEWPPEMKLGESDLVRIALVPAYEGYSVTVDFPSNTTITKPVEVQRIENYDLFAVGQLVGAGFAIQEEANPKKLLPPGQTVDWRWSIRPNDAGQQKLAITLKLRWEPIAGGSAQGAGQPKEADLFSKAMNVNVASVLGMSAGQASSMGMMGTMAGMALALFGFVFRRAPKVKATVAQMLNPNANLKIEPQAKITLQNDETSLLQTLFGKYARVALENEFRSGYSGARTFLAHPIREDGRADAYTIAKIGPRVSMQREFDNYERFVKDTLPPITARIQEPPVTAPALVNRDDKAVLRYTFIGEQGKMPVSLRQSLLADPDSTLINQLFETFGPNWWMQRKPYTFRLAQEYDRMLPAHFVVEPFEGQARGAKLMDGRKPPGQDAYTIGDIVVLQNFPSVELRVDGTSLSLTGQAAPGQPPLRVRWQASDSQTRFLKETWFVNRGTFGKVIGTRESLLRESVMGVDLQGLPDPILKLPTRLSESVAGTQSTIHGDLNLENGLVGPGGMIWLIDFAETRDGHTLYDFAHLEAEILAHVIAPRTTNTTEFLAILQSESHLLLNQMHAIAAKCLFNPTALREYWLALYATCLGAIKYANLNAHQRQCLYVAAAYVGNKL